MEKMNKLVQELAEQNADESIGDVDELGVLAAIVRGDLVEAANDLGYDLSHSLAEQMHNLRGAIVYIDGEEVDVQTFDNEDELEDRWDAVAAIVESRLETREQLED